MSLTIKSLNLVDHPLRVLFAEGDLSPVTDAGGNPLPKQGNNVPVQTMRYDMSGFLRQCVQKYEELSGRKLDKNKVVATPFLDENLKINKHDTDGVLSTMAVRILMKVLYAARIGRWDLLRSVTYLSRRVTRWTPDCDRRLLKLMMYINCTVDHMAEAFTGESMNSCQLAVCCDSDLASDMKIRNRQAAFGLRFSVNIHIGHW